MPNLPDLGDKKGKFTDSWNGGQVPPPLYILYYILFKLKVRIGWEGWNGPLFIGVNTGQPFDKGCLLGWDSQY